MSIHVDCLRLQPGRQLGVQRARHRNKRFALLQMQFVTLRIARNPMDVLLVDDEAFVATDEGRVRGQLLFKGTQATPQQQLFAPLPFEVMHFYIIVGRLQKQQLFSRQAKAVRLVLPLQAQLLLDAQVGVFRKLFVEHV